MADNAISTPAADAAIALGRAIEMLNVAQAIIAGPQPDWDTACHMLRTAEGLLRDVQAPPPPRPAIVTPLAALPARCERAARIDLSVVPSSMELLAASWRTAPTPSPKENRHG